MRLALSIGLSVLLANLAACAPGEAEAACEPSGNMPVVRPDTSRFKTPTVDPGPSPDSAMVVRPPCPDSAR